MRKAGHLSGELANEGSAVDDGDVVIGATAGTASVDAAD